MVDRLFFRRLKMKIRGCSTLEMQLIRNIGIEKVMISALFVERCLNSYIHISF